MSRIISAISVLVLMLLFFSSSRAMEKSVQANGESHISRQDAIREAQRSAVEKAVGIFVLSETEVENFRLKKDRVFSRAEGYIIRFNVIEEIKVRDAYRVKINAVVSLDKIKDDLVALKILLDSMERPKIMVLIEEDYQGMDRPNMDIVQTEISRLLGGRGFDLVDKAQLDGVENLEKSRQALLRNRAAARSIGMRLGAQYVILGKAVAQDAGEAYPGTGLKTIHVGVELRIIQTQTGSVLGSVVKNAVTAHISPLSGASKALKESAKKAVDEYLVDAISNSFQDFLNNGAPIRLTVNNVKTFRDYKLITASIQALERVVSNRKEGWNKAGGILAIGLHFKGTSEELATVLDSRQVGTKALEVVDFAPERVICSLIAVSEKGGPQQ